MARADAPALSVVVCTYNGADLLPGCLESLAAQTLAPERFEVLIVDNNSTDASREIADGFAERYPHFRVLEERQQGLSHARNRGWKAASGELVAFLDDDAKAAPDWCERIVDAFATVQPSPAAVGGEIHPFFEEPPPAWFTDELEVRTWGPSAEFLQPPRAPFGFSGSNMAFPRRILEEYGGFSSAFGMTGATTRMGEDSELFSRLYKDKPWFWYDPAIVVFHWTPARNMTPSYRFWRSYRAGEAMARIHRRRPLSLSTVTNATSIAVFLVASPIALARGNDKLSTRLVKRLEALGAKLGYLMGR